ncbi:MAG: MFS transporter [Caulobacteraceae bacterium]|nr:MFS transporter [Caulobacteraceae bacterium]
MVETRLPARLDRLPWSRFHWLVIMALGVTWILDGLEVTLVGALAPAITDLRALGLTPGQMGFTASAYLAGAVLGAVVFGRLTDAVGRKPMFSVTVGLYLLATLATGLAWNYSAFLVFRFLTGLGIGGEYGAINSAIQELIPARRRGVTDLSVNGSYWAGAAVGAAGSLVLLNPAILPVAWGWRLGFLLGAVLALAVLLIRQYVPESPRWLMTHGRVAEAEAVVDEIEQRVRAAGGTVEPVESAQVLRLKPGAHGGWLAVLRVLVVGYPRRTAVGLVLMASQAFCYNAIFFTYAMILGRFYAVPPAEIGWFLLPFAAGNVAGPVLLGPLFDSLGRRKMIAATYGLAGVLLTLSGWLFAQGLLTAVSQTLAWTVIFFFASAAASSAYLTVGESFPLEVRAIAISLFYAFGTALGGVAAPALFGVLIGQGSRVHILWGYLVGAGAMLAAALAEALFGLDAEGKSLEAVAAPIARAD